ncbi:41484_t:CDS:2 [Gigaspora margarita]|uniref:41484_t:CDS:1 n=1 Tax=Gigaspora margarita TaxID=4874 RepID=A0ABN7VVF8_GIGMA|nr:41484_t:CDS:2 [Gigaspora margarita]
MVNGQQYLDTNYPNASRASITELDLSNKNLEGEMTFSGFISLLKLNLSFNMITAISYSLPSIQQVDVSHNLLTSSNTLSGPGLELNCSNNPITLLPLNITSKLTSFDCMGIQFSKTDTAKTSLPISPTSANSLPTSPTSANSLPISPTSANSCNSFNLVIGLGIPLFLSILGWIALGIIFFYKRRFKKILLISGDSHST